jgi:hypothetical protein
VDKSRGARVRADPTRIGPGQALFGFQGSNADHTRMCVIGHVHPAHAGQPGRRALGETEAVFSQMEAFIRGRELPVSLHRFEAILPILSVANRHAWSKEGLLPHACNIIRARLWHLLDGSPWSMVRGRNNPQERPESPSSHR